MKLFEKFMYPILIIFLLVAIYVSHNDLHYFESTMVAQDGLFQWMTFYTILFASIMCFYRASILKPFRGGVFSGCQIAFGIVFLFFAMDEMSWLQRILGYNSPEFFQRYNTRMQVNFHHLVFYGFRLNNIIFTLAIKILATIYFLVLPFLYPRIERLRTFVNRFAIPLPSYFHTGAYFVLAGLMAFIPSEFKYVIFEFGFYWLLVLMMYHPLNDEVFSRVSLVR